MHEHANKTRACAGNSNARSQLHAPTDVAAPGRAFPASWQALQAPQRRRRQHTDRDYTNIPDKEDEVRAQCKAPRCCVQCEHHASLPPPNAPFPMHSSRSCSLTRNETHVQAVPGWRSVLPVRMQTRSGLMVVVSPPAIALLPTPLVAAPAGRAFTSTTLTLVSEDQSVCVALFY